MRLDISETERSYLTALLENVYRELLRELNRTDSLEFKSQLKETLRVLDGLRMRIERTDAAEEMTGLPEEVT